MPVDLVEAGRQLLNDLGRPDVTVESLTPLPGVAHVDLGHSTQVVTNLVSNAYRYGRSPIEIDASHDHRTLTVVDAGPGVDPGGDDCGDRHRRPLRVLQRPGGRRGRRPRDRGRGPVVRDCRWCGARRG